MLLQESLRTLAAQYHTSEYPNTVREYFQHLFLTEFYKREASTNFLFKGGTALRIVYGSPRFSEDLDFSLFNVVAHEQMSVIENLFQDVLVEFEQMGVKVSLGDKFGQTKEGYVGKANVQIYDYPPITIEINITNRNGRKIQGEIATIANDFVPTYNVFHLPQKNIVEEKIFSALLERHKVRDYYDLYFIMRKGLLIGEFKIRLQTEKERILELADKIRFDEELGALLPTDQQLIIRDFKRTLSAELERQLASS